MRPIGPIAAIVVGVAVSAVGCRHDTAPEPPGASAPGDASATGRPATPPNALTLPAASIEAVLNPEKLPPYAGPVGGVEGTIYVKGPDAPDMPNLDVHVCPAAIDTYGKLFRAGPPTPSGTRPLADAIVGVTGYSGFYLADTSPAVKVTINASCAYPTTTIAVTFGQRLEIDNASKIAFAPRLEGIFQPAVMIAPPELNGGPVKLYPTHTGWFALVDSLQLFVRGNVYVVRQPLHAVSDVQGHYRIDGVPTGKLKVSALLPAIQSGANADVDVRANVVEHVDMTITFELRETDAGARAMPRVIP
jgi:hypothetical protein